MVMVALCMQGHVCTFRPLHCLVRICFFGHLLDLPGTPGFVSEGPVLDLQDRVSTDRCLVDDRHTLYGCSRPFLRRRLA